MANMNVDYAHLAPTNLRSDEECSRIASPIGSGFRYACLPIPEAERRAVTALRAFDLTLTEITDTRADTQIARRKLDWWRNTLHQSCTHHTAEHPILQSLLAAIDQPTLNDLVPYFEARLGAAVIELDYQGFEMQSDLDAYLDASGGAMYHLYARVLQASPDTHAELGQLGALHHRLFRLTYLGRHVHRGQIYLPAEQLTRSGLTEADFHRPDAPKQLAVLLQTELSDIENKQAEAISRLRAITPKPPTFFRAMIALDRAQMALLRRHEAQVLTSRPETTPFTRLVSAWWGSKRPLPKIRPSSST